MTVLSTAISELRARAIPPVEKGFAGWSEPVSAVSLAARRPALFDAGFSYPVMTLRESALAHNITGLARYCADAGVLLAPHGKTHMAPQLAAAQLDAGAWGVTVATIGQLRAYRSFGFARLFLANELVDRAGIMWLATELAADQEFEPYVYVDSVAGVAILDSVLAKAKVGRPLNVLVEKGHANGRTGVRGSADAVAVAKAAAATSTLRVVGVSGYEGGISHDATAESLAAIAAYAQDLRALLRELRGAGLIDETPILSAGGSLYFDVIVRELTAPFDSGLTPRVVLRSGAYVTHDHGVYGEFSPVARAAAPGLSLISALELWTQVLSRPEPGLALLNAGRRDVSFDEGLPTVLRTADATDVTGWTVTRLNDQHGYLTLPADAPLAPGDLVCLGISHPCTAFDKWRVLPVVDDTGQVVDAVHTFF